MEAKLAALRALGVRKVAPVEVKAESDRVNDAEEEEQQRAGADYKLFYAAYYEKFGEVTRLLAEGANPNGYKSWVRACARAASLPAAPAPLPRPCQLRGTHHPHHAAAAHRSGAGPPSCGPAATGTRQSCRRC